MKVQHVLAGLPFLGILVGMFFANSRSTAGSGTRENRGSSSATRAPSSPDRVAVLTIAVTAKFTTSARADGVDRLRVA